MMTRRFPWAVLFVMVVIGSCGEGPEGRTVAALRPGYAPELYTSLRIDATVVNAETGKPVSGAAVVAIWREVDVFVERWSHQQFAVFETETDAQGRFTLHRWGPRPASPNGFIDKRSPEIWVLKEGYLVGFFDNSGERTPSLPLAALSDPNVPIDYVTLPPNKMAGWSRGAYARAAEASSVWNGKTLMLRRAVSAEQLAGSLAAANPFPLALNFKLSPLPGYWAEWHRSHDSLPADLRAQVPFPPRSLADYSIVARLASVRSQTLL